MAKTNTQVKTEETITQNDTNIVEQVTAPAPQHDVNALMGELKTKSAVIRHLSSLGLKTGEINKAFETAGVKMRYQHVRNVLTAKPKKG